MADKKITSIADLRKLSDKMEAETEAEHMRRRREEALKDPNVSAQRKAAIRKAMKGVDKRNGKN